MPTHYRALLFSIMLAACLLAIPVAAQQATPPAAPPPGPPPTPGPTMSDALKALEVARAAATKQNLLLTCAVVDSRGDLVALSRMDGARFYTADIARGKAMVAALFGQPSGNMATFGAQPFFSNLNTAAQGRLYPIQGAVPIMKGTQVLGGIGCSGASSALDEETAKTGLSSFTN